MTKRSKKKRSRSKTSAVRATAEYREAVRRADQVLAMNDVQVRRDNWQVFALQWFAGTDRDREALARYVESHPDQLGVGWARDLLRLEVFFRAGDPPTIIARYDRALAGYPPCPLVEMYVGEQIFRHAADHTASPRVPSPTNRRGAQSNTASPPRRPQPRS
jgi:hypothetical protein